MVISEDNKLNVIKDLYCHWDRNFWYSVYIYLIIQGFIIIALTEVLKSTAIIANENIIISLLVISGILFSIIWCLVLNRKFKFVELSQDKLKNFLGGDIWDNIEKNSDIRKNFKDFSFIRSSVLINKILTTGFLIIWLAIGFILRINIIWFIVSLIGLFILILIVWFVYIKSDKKLKK